MKLCKDCKHSKRDFTFGWQFGKCMREPPAVDPVDGKQKKTGLYCSTQREFPHLCGPEAKYFEQKPTLVERLEGLMP
jgi:hypothetical protein